MKKKIWDLYAPIYEKAMLAERLNSSGNAPSPRQIPTVTADITRRNHKKKHRSV